MGTQLRVLVSGLSKQGARDARHAYTQNQVLWFGPQKCITYIAKVDFGQPGCRYAWCVLVEESE